MTINRFFYGTGLFFFWLMLVIPTTYQLERGMLLAILLIVSVIHMFYGEWKLDRDIALLGLICVTSSLFFMTNGVLNNTPGAIHVGTVYVIWPLLFLFLVGSLNRPDQLFPFLYVVVIGGICAAIMGILIVTEGIGTFDLGLSSMLEDQGARLGIYEGAIAFNLFNMTTVIYSLPFLLAALLLPVEYCPFKGGWVIITWIGLLSAIVVLIVSGRRAFWLIAAISPLVVLCFAKICRIRIRLISLLTTGSIIISCALIVLPFFDVDLRSIWNNFTYGFEFPDVENVSAYTRYEQFFALIDGWMENPIFGAGHGASSTQWISSEDQPWAYELSYIALLFQTGIIGIAIYAGAVAWLYSACLKVMRKQPQTIKMLLPLLTGLTCFLVANATNPYFLKFDYLWTIFLPIAVLNSYLVSKNA